MTDEPLRERILERIRELSPQQLAALEQFLNRSVAPDAVVQLEKPWPHAPVHRLSEHGTFLVTAGTLYKQHHFHQARRLDLLEQKLLELARRHGWQLEAWAVFSNHYHFIGHSQTDSARLNDFLGHLPTDTATAVNQLDGVVGRTVWHNFWETKLTYERSYLARLNYVHQNPVKHGLVSAANQYRWCSASWFERTATRAQVNTIYSFKTDRLNVLDGFDALTPSD